MQSRHVVRLALVGERIITNSPAIVCRRHPDNPAKHRAEVALIAEAYLLADAGH
jgi:hypothetical protein